MLPKEKEKEHYVCCFLCIVFDLDVYYRVCDIGWY